MDNIIKNPIFIAVVAGVIVYSYIIWKNKDKSKKKKTSKTNLDINKFYIDKLYIKINDKINELLA